MCKFELGFIGTGNMGGALATAAAKVVDPRRILLANRTPGKTKALADQLSCAVGGNEDAAQARFILLGVKPQMMADMLAGIAPVLKARTDRFVLVTMAAGLSMAKIAHLAGGDYPVIRIMPNTPAAIGQGMILLAANELVTAQEQADFTAAFRMAGVIDSLDEKLMDAGSAISGCGPAFAYLFMEALADGGVACGLPRSKALMYAANMLSGAAALAAQSGQHPGQLKDAVCSPAGSTIMGVKALEDGAFRASCMNAVLAAYNRTKELGN